MRLSTLISSCLILSCVALCLVVLAAAIIAVNLPSKAERVFGPPSNELDPPQKILMSAKLLLQVDDLREPADIQGIEQQFEIQMGESTYDITERLQQEGLVRNAEALRDYLVYRGLDTTLQTGKFNLSSRMTAMEVASALQDATPGEVTFRILPGWRMEEIAAALPTSGLTFTPETFISAVTNPPPNHPLAQELPPGVTLEGFLYPDSYRLPRQIGVDEFVSTLIEDFQVKVNQELRSGFVEQGLSLFQAVILASIVQREAIVEDEMPLIASVFLNRLNQGMKLDSDPTVQYALGYDPVKMGWWKSPLSLDDLQINSPYNTYLATGLPPGPIANPGLNALKAVAFPAQTPYFYFRAACDGSGKHIFAETFEEHQQNACP